MSLSCTDQVFGAFSKVVRFPELREALIYQMRFMEGKLVYRLSAYFNKWGFLCEAIRHGPEVYQPICGADTFQDLLSMVGLLLHPRTEDPLWRSDDCCCTVIYLCTLLSNSNVMQYTFIASFRAPTRHMFKACYVHPIRFKCTIILRVLLAMKFWDSGYWNCLYSGWGNLMRLIDLYIWNWMINLWLLAGYALIWKRIGYAHFFFTQKEALPLTTGSRHIDKLVQSLGLTHILMRAGLQITNPVSSQTVWYPVTHLSK